MTERLLVVRGGALGDFLLGLPALGALREAFPRARLELIAPGAVLPLACSLVDVATPLERAEVAPLFGDAELPGDLAGRYRGLDLVVVWLADADGSVRGAFERLGACRVLWAPALPSGPGRHATDHLMATLAPLGISGSPAVPTVRPVDAALQRALPVLNRVGLDTGPATTRTPGHQESESPSESSFLSSCLRGEGPIAIHPGSGGTWKTWPPERFAGVVDRLTASGLPVVLIQGPADAAAARRVLADVQGGQPPLIVGLAVEELAAILSLCSCYLGNDSGVTHLAAAVGTPTVALFGPTDPAVWGPRGPRVVVLRGERECAPCSRETAITCRTRACLEGIGVEQVVETIQKLIFLTSGT